MFESVNELILDLAGQPWVFAAVAAVAALDAFFPPLPSESVIVALAALGGAVNLWVLGLVGAAGALIGDSIAFAIGRRVGTDRFAWQRRPRTAKALEWAGREIDRRGGMLIFTARYIPVGRIAVMLTSGATGMSWRRFLSYAVLACSAWSAWSVLVGAVAGEALSDQPLLAAVVGIAIALAVGLIMDRVVARVTGSRPSPDAEPQPVERPAP